MSIPQRASLDYSTHNSALLAAIVERATLLLIPSRLHGTILNAKWTWDNGFYIRFVGFYILFVITAFEWKLQGRQGPFLSFFFVISLMF